MTTYSLSKASPEKIRADLVVVGVLADGGSGRPVVAAGGEDVARAWGRGWNALLAGMGVTGKEGETVRIPTSGTIRAATLLVVGLGATHDGQDPTAESVRRAAGAASRAVGNAASVAVALPAADTDQVRAVAEGFLAGQYSFRATGSAKAAKNGSAADGSVSDVALLTPLSRQEAARQALADAQVVARHTDLVRTWVNTPPNRLRPADLAAAVEELHQGAKKRPVTLTVLDEHALAELGCGGILGVGAGSDSPPRLLKVEYRPGRSGRGRSARSDAAGHVALVGKGITYDSGGLSIKPAPSMATMKMDMAGAAAVVAATYALAELEVPVAVTAFAPLAENMLSGAAYRPGDVLTMHDGQTVEVMNTDAEGRLVLADALALAVEEQPDAIVNVATLHGATVVALGERIAGVFGDDPTVTEVLDAAERTGELMWRLPVPEETAAAVRTESKIADLLQHRFVRWGSASFAAAFLQAFTGDRPFAHVDIAGPAYNSGGAWGATPSGGTGFGVRTLVEWVSARAAGADAEADDGS